MLRGLTVPGALHVDRTLEFFTNFYLQEIPQLERSRV
jgi:hypothetical protein